MSGPSVIVISYHFYPSNEIGARRITAFARFLAEKGLRVVVISAFGDSSVKVGSEVLPGLIAVPVRRPPRTFIDAIVFLKRRVFRAKAIVTRQSQSHPVSLAGSASSDSIWARMRNLYFRTVYFIDDYKSWGRRALKAAVEEAKKYPPALVLSSSPPLTMLLTGTFAARRLHVPHVVDLRDPWADAVAHLYPDRRLELALARRIERWAMRSATAIIATSSNLAHLLTERYAGLAAKTFVVRNGYDGSFRQASLDTGGRLAILFAGELYLNRDPFPLLCALERLLSRPNVDASRVSVTFMGRKTEHTERLASSWLQDKRCARIVKFVPPQPAEVVAEASRQSTVLLNLAQHQPLTVPAKTFEHLASGRENLLLCEDDSESARLVARIPGVIQVDPRDAAALDRALLDLYERHVNHGQLRAPAEKEAAAFSRASAHAEFWQIVTSVLPLSASRAARTHDVEPPSHN